jgi:hypothetical protein
VALGFASEGAAVGILGRSRAQLDQTLAQIEAAAGGCVKRCVEKTERCH